MQGDQAIYGVGGGITWDSKWEGEYQETKQNRRFFTGKSLDLSF